MPHTLWLFGRRAALGRRKLALRNTLFKGYGWDNFLAIIRAWDCAPGGRNIYGDGKAAVSTPTRRREVDARFVRDPAYHTVVRNRYRGLEQHAPHCYMPPLDERGHFLS